jgi:hypothetical protein
MFIITYALKQNSYMVIIQFYNFFFNKFCVFFLVHRRKYMQVLS